jgi:hypothetical protein
MTVDGGKIRFSDEERLVFAELERRKAAMEDPCDSCRGSGLMEVGDVRTVCDHCLGQKVLLKREEWDLLYEIHNGTKPDRIDADALHAEMTKILTDNLWPEVLDG